jgi:Amt family ammonium transporter
MVAFIFLAGCAVVTIWESLIIGAVGSFLASITDPLLVWLRVDDAVGATCVHGFGGAWGLIAVGIFAAKDELDHYCEYNGVLHGGGGYLLGVQIMAVVIMSTWAMVVTFILLFVNIHKI